MTKQYNIFMLANDLKFAEFFVEAYPRQSFNNIQFHIVTDTRKFGDDLRESIVHTFARSNKPDLMSALFHCGKTIMERSEEYFEGPGFNREFYHDHPTSLKLVAPIWLTKKYNVEKMLYIDDDVMIMRDPRPIIDKYEWAMTGDSFCELHGPWASRYVEAFSEIVGKHISLEEYNTKRMCNGVIVMSATPEWLTAVTNFYSHPTIREVWEKCTTSKKYNRAFFLEQFFTNFFFKANGGWERFAADEVSFASKSLCDPAKRPKRFMKIKPIYHYAVGISKYDWIEAFKTVGIADQGFLRDYGLPPWLESQDKSLSD